MLVPFCSVQRRSTGSVLPELGCIFKTTRQAFRFGDVKNLIVHNCRVGAAIGDGLRRIVFGNGVQPGPGKINHDLPASRADSDRGRCAWIQPCCHGQFHIRFARPIERVAKAATVSGARVCPWDPKTRRCCRSPRKLALNCTRCRLPSPQFPCGSTHTVGTRW